jgi:hypothetical protein
VRHVLLEGPGHGGEFADSEFERERVIGHSRAPPSFSV